jgi:hypothetical protein
MRLVGWNDIPCGYGAEFELDSAPWWLRAWFRTPFVDRFAHRLAVRRGYGWLSPHPGGEPGPVAEDGWRIRPDGYTSPGAVAFLRPVDDRYKGLDPAGQ